MIGPLATVATWVRLPAGAQLAQAGPTGSALNPIFTRPVHITDSRQVLVVGPVGSRLNLLTAVYGQGLGHDEVYVYTGCYGGTLEDFEAAVVGRKGLGDPHRAQYELVITLLRRMISYRGVPSPPKRYDDDWGS